MRDAYESRKKEWLGSNFLEHLIRCRKVLERYVWGGKQLDPNPAVQWLELPVHSMKGAREFYLIDIK